MQQIAVIGEISRLRSLTCWEAVWGNRATRPEPEHEPVRPTEFQSVCAIRLTRSDFSLTRSYILIS